MRCPYIHGVRSWSVSPLTTLATVAILATLLTACGGATGSRPVTKSVTRQVGKSAKTVPAAASFAGGQQLSAQIVAAWKAAEDAFETASRTADPSEPALFATTVSPELAKMWSYLESLHTAGYIGTGPVDHGKPVVLDVKANVATVRTCIWDAEIAVSAATGQHALGVLGTKDFELVTSTMTRTTDGWKLSDQAVGVGKCHRA
jgi:hypothetical protein